MTMAGAATTKNSLARPFVEGLADNVLRYQRCAACGAAQTLARYACAQCGSTQLQWHEAAGRGMVYATTIVNRAPSDVFRVLVPYTLALVDLDEGFRLLGHGEPGLAIGDLVTAHVFEHAGRRLVSFKRF
jgi:uncharacterized protein